ncbi:NAD(P)-binding protein [Viridothelium virens]|uniref:NAD(P)-binding protein n=1 Tax=Viridothelium virens TaxID=1048519 RepID=A0A6A6GX82_VIRVR|nr:NAD(P)-binding protein [Viridothelium virens]
MAIYIAIQAFFDGIGSIPFAIPILKTLPWLVGIYLLKWFFGGARNTSERNMHSKVVMITGGTSGIGAEVARELASRGAQLILLTQQPLTDAFLIDYIMDLRTSTNNELINAERVDLSSLHSIRQFATKWVDNAPPRRLDMIILCASTLTPMGSKIAVTEDGMESNWGINYLANFHFLSMLSPALRAQPPDRDVRIIMGTCSSYIGGDLATISTASPATRSRGKPSTNTPSSEPSAFKPSTAYATSKLALTTFALALQKHLSSYKRPDGAEMNARILLVNPGFVRTPGTRRYLTMGSLLGLLVYLLTYPFWWLVLKSPNQGAQSFLYAAMEARFGRGEGGWLIRECSEVPYAREEVKDERVQKELWELSEKTIERVEKDGARIIGRKS